MPRNTDIVAFLLQLNQTRASKAAAGEPITPPGLPLPAEEHGKSITSDCMTLEL